MKNNKGFTLIELLAVIVILAIIALIASPIIIGLIDDARKEAAASSGHGVYGAAQNVLAKVLILNNDGITKQLKYTFGAGGTVAITALTATDTWTPITTDALAAEHLGTGVTLAAITLDYNGTKPTGGILTIDTNGQVNIDAAGLTINSYICTYSTSTTSFTCASS